MDLVALTQQLKAYVPCFGGRVAGLAEFNESMMGQIRPEALPAAYVMPLGEDAEPNDEQNALYQLVTQRVAVVVEFDNTLDRRGQSVTWLYSPTLKQIHAAILNWRGTDPEHALRGFEYASCTLLPWDSARVFYQFEYTLLIVITDLDGWQIDTPYLKEIDANMEPGDPAPGFKYIAPIPPPAEKQG